MPDEAGFGQKPEFEPQNQSGRTMIRYVWSGVNAAADQDLAG